MCWYVRVRGDRRSGRAWKREVPDELGEPRTKRTQTSLLIRDYCRARYVNALRAQTSPLGLRRGVGGRSVLQRVADHLARGGSHGGKRRALFERSTSARASAVGPDGRRGRRANGWDLCSPG